ncbi:tautomerase family protein [Oceanobacillus polygoni]|uniref:Imidazole glycerol phosphate synthase subunit HisF n=1 Tax=Oceanobacillus polygoni TaxID=1235259 RepID=A0A9X0YNN5_9BACI|nr:tautomerase family protein [Oceanobacillus polygoni]MBP2075992.1 imidazole glycerol phosphate synthase subunit HisF [Oceanobacillus polygoni]
MPLIRFDVIEGRTDEALKVLLDATHDAVVRAFGVPERDRFQIITQHKKNEMIIQDTGLGFERSDQVVVISIRSTQRSDKAKKEFYQILVKELGERCGIEPHDVMVSIVTNGAGEWSFGFGKAQFLTGEL